METTNANVYDICKTALLADYLTVQTSSINRKFLNKFIPPKKQNVAKLIDHVRQVFNINDTDMAQIIRNCQSFCTEEFALVDLLIRKNMLDNNVTPEYMPNDFDHADDYELWKNAELQELESAISYIIQHYPHTDALRNTPLPTQNAKLCFIPNDPKTVYYALLEHLISFDDTLSNSATLLLSECGRRWRLSLAFRAYSYLNLIWKNNKETKYSSTLRICEMITKKEFLLNNQEQYDVYLIFKKVEKLSYKQLESDDLLSIPWNELCRVLNQVYISPVYRKFHKPDIPSLRISKVIEKSINARLKPLNDLDNTATNYLSTLVTNISHLIKDTSQIERLEIEDDDAIALLVPQFLFKSTCESFLNDKLQSFIIPDSQIDVDYMLSILDECEHLQQLGLSIVLPDLILSSTLLEYINTQTDEMREWCSRAISLDDFQFHKNAPFSSSVSDVYDVLRTKWLDIRDTHWMQYDLQAQQLIIFAIYFVVEDVSKTLFESVIGDFQIDQDLEVEDIRTTLKETILDRVDRLRSAPQQALEFKIKEMPPAMFVKLNDLQSLQMKLNDLFTEIRQVWTETPMEKQKQTTNQLVRLSIAAIKGVVKHDAHEGEDHGFVANVQINQSTFKLQLPDIGTLPVEADECCDFILRDKQEIQLTIYSQDIFGNTKKYANTTFTVDARDVRTPYYTASPRIYNLNTLLGTVSVVFGHVQSEMPFYYFNKAYLTLNDFLQLSCQKVVSNMMDPCIWYINQFIANIDDDQINQRLEQVEQQLQPIFDYLNTTLGDLVEVCHVEIAQHILKRCWRHCLTGIEGILLGELAETKAQITATHFIFNCLEEFFHAQGSGVELHHLHNPQYLRVNALFTLYNTENDVLMQMYLRSFVNYAVHTVDKVHGKKKQQLAVGLESSEDEAAPDQELMPNTKMQPNTPLSPPECEAVVKLLEMRSNYDQECMDFLEQQQGIQQQVILNLELEKVRQRQENKNSKEEPEIEVIEYGTAQEYKYTPFKEEEAKKPGKSVNVQRIPKQGLTDVESMTKPRKSVYYERSREYL